MTYTLADAIRAQFERAHPNGKNTLLCDQCRHRKDREDFRETPWHGRAVACKSCEGFRWIDHLYAEQCWQLEQERAKVRMLIRHVQRLRMQRILTPLVSSADAFEAYHQPYYDALERAQRRFLAAYLTLPEPVFERRRKRARLTKENR
ncbi:hypothetical protein PV332_10545 [Streptomyces scabiei]|uniref:hypothetical protein n=1 Tax=Streptomyces scabiei TaxID=1930 RepID=UPI0029BEFB19|nr:hypothetical protein [Streptomyces scabiei]MDX2575919.1 hypothetical protein [Streptomyces scabiei]MDX2885608.1 hypothetical protein [Streptomyces scabiei]MDX2993439.1 hypothetical protein [Streptomyces scabiei]MDX3028447.1 hypothetical protein [Streptomyces scabiei]MDX3047219.1 hypothetical protein [Streptomyces scabiei]